MSGNNSVSVDLAHFHFARLRQQIALIEVDLKKFRALLEEANDGLVRQLVAAPEFDVDKLRALLGEASDGLVRQLLAIIEGDTGQRQRALLG